LERRGTPPVLFVTRGFRDLLAIGNQQREDLFAVRVVKSEPLYSEVVQVDERMAADGTVEKALDLTRLEGPAGEAVERGSRVAAVALLHSYRNSLHERQLERFLKDLGFLHVSISSDLSSRLKIVPRAETAVVDAYLAEAVGDHLSRVMSGVGSTSMHVMTSAGGLVRSSSYRAKDSLLSGPAAGVVGAVAAGERSHVERLLAFDMGGTSTDVTRHDGDLEYQSETVVGGARLASPSLAVETVAAGGGSICRFDGRQLKVGPQSAGADPGPACYGKGGPLTLTDVNLLLGRLLGERFPFGVDVESAEERAREIVSLHRARSGIELTTADLLFGFLLIANEKMAGAVRAISLRAGYRPADYSLLTFGGAGPQHACALAGLLGVGRVLIPGDAALLSAVGLGHADLERFAERQVLEDLASAGPRLDGWFEDLAREAATRLAEEGVTESRVRVKRRDIFLRFSGQEATLGIEWNPDRDVASSFASAYQEHFGYCPDGRHLEVESLRLIASEVGEGVEMTAAPATAAATTGETRKAMFSTGGWVEAAVVERQTLGMGNVLGGPALIIEDHTATVVEPGWKAELDAAGAVVLERV
jgi:5-oxoprolinase (ATP-hydrolysing)